MLCDIVKNIDAVSTKDYYVKWDTCQTFSTKRKGIAGIVIKDTAEPCV